MRKFKILLSIFLAVVMIAATFTAPVSVMADDIDEKVYTLVDSDTIEFGTYPQSEVTDSTLKSTLTSAVGSLPTSSNSYSWTSYGYYADGSVSNYMWYQDIIHGGEKYRGVYFTSYRPNYGTAASSTDNTYQDENGYYTSTVYWFKFDHISWTILSEDGETALVLCDMIIDSQQYDYVNGSYDNNYANSTIRAWLNDNFYNTAFSAMQQQIILTTEVDNSAASTGNSTNEYACANTNDKIFLLSYDEVTDSNYGFSISSSAYDKARAKQTTDYAQSQGAYTSIASEDYGNGWWWLRSPNCGASDDARVVNCGAYVTRSYVNTGKNGVLPALQMNLAASHGCGDFDKDNNCDICNKEIAYYTVIDSDTIEFGSYPQSEVTDSTLKSTLTSAAGSLPTSENSYNWTSYGYYADGSVSNYMWYQDITHGGEKYRGVYFTSYRPSWINDTLGSASYHDDNGYSANEVHWFKFDPISWRILNRDGDTALIFCDMIIDSQHYGTDSNYANSYIRAWLNDNFYDSAFTTLQKSIILTTEVDNSAESAGYLSSSYACDNTNDKVFLLSYVEATNIDYGFLNDYSDDCSARQKQVTAYAFSQGAYCNNYYSCGSWWLRSPYNHGDYMARVGDAPGRIERDCVYYTHTGVAPALRMELDTLHTCGDFDNDHKCDICSSEISTCADGNRDHDCDTCGEPISECADGNRDHDCDTCGGELSICADTSPKDHFCDTCNAWMGVHEEEEKGHYCSYCGELIGSCEDRDSDHDCDRCGSSLSECEDVNPYDHNCDICGDPVSECYDPTDDVDHGCDVCGKKLSDCYDADDHKCDVCWEILSECSDGLDSDHACDVCGKIASECYDDNNDHFCDECTSQMSYCADEDANGECDACGDELPVDTSPEVIPPEVETRPDDDREEETFFDPNDPFKYCVDNDTNHYCDDCNKVISVCIDDGFDHLCDICSRTLTPCIDPDRDHFCNICTMKISDCSDVNGDGSCDRCGLETEGIEKGTGEEADTYPEQEKDDIEGIPATKPEADTLEMPNDEVNVQFSSGCGMTLGAGTMAVVLAIGCLTLAKKKKETD